MSEHKTADMDTIGSPDQAFNLRCGLYPQCRKGKGDQTDHNKVCKQIIADIDDFHKNGTGKCG